MAYQSYPPQPGQHYAPQFGGHYPGYGQPTSKAPIVMYLLTAVATILAGALPQFGGAYGSDSSMFSEGGVQLVGALLIPAVLLVGAAIACTTAKAAHGLAGGAGMAVFSVFGGKALTVFKVTEGHGLGAGPYLMILAALLGLISLFVSIGRSPRTKDAWGMLLVVAAALVSIGVTLVPAKVDGVSLRGMTWASWNGFGDGVDPIRGIAAQIVIWGALIAVLIGASRGGRSAGWYAPLAWNVAYLATKDSPSRVHPLAIGALIALGVLALIAIAASPGQSQPAYAGPGWGDQYPGAPAPNYPAPPSTYAAPTASYPAQPTDPNQWGTQPAPATYVDPWAEPMTPDPYPADIWGAQPDDSDATMLRQNPPNTPAQPSQPLLSTPAEPAAWWEKAPPSRPDR